MQMSRFVVRLVAIALQVTLFAELAHAQAGTTTGGTSGNWQAIGIIATAVVGIAGFLATYVNNMLLEKQRANVAFISAQLEKLYGPLLALNSASSEAWQQFRKYCRPNKIYFFNDNDPLTEDEAREFRHWMTIVFMPANIAMQKVISENAHLIDGSTMPKEFLDLLAHVQVYNAVVAKWKPDDAGPALTGGITNTSYLKYPEAIGPYVARKFNKLKARQDRLLAKDRRAGWISEAIFGTRKLRAPYRARIRAIRRLMRIKP
jgi:hypothetical protein